eukprot:gene3621-3965_t
MIALATLCTATHPGCAAQGRTDADLVRIVTEDIAERQALVTADISRSIYSDDCVFQDDIGTYSLPNYIQGTKALFIPEESHVDLDGVVQLDRSSHPPTINFRFHEVLAFRLPAGLHPKAELSGVVKLDLDDDGLIIYSREKWDQSVWKILSSLRL